MNKRLLFMALFLVLPVFSVTESYTDTQYVGCDRSFVSTSQFPQFDCSNGILSNVICSPEPYCTAICSDFITPRCSVSECVGSEIYSGSCGKFLTTISLSGRYTQEEAENSIHLLDTCPYDKINSLSIEYFCDGEPSNLIFGYPFCFFGYPTTEVYITCEKPQCTLTLDRAVSCEMENYETTQIYEVSAGGLCTPNQERCEGLKRLTCNSNGEWIEDGARCSELCCDVDNEFSSVYCNRINEFINDKKALCVSLEDSNDYFTCESGEEGDYRCNEDLVEKCSSGGWQNYETCKYTCNSTAAGDSDIENFCTTYNKIVGGCDNFDTFCHKVGGDAFLFTCSVEDWVLTKECGSGRCDVDGDACYEGCELFSEFCYAENNSCYYCNQLGDYVYDGVCQTDVNNITLECSSDLSCREGASRCAADWVILCEGEDWITSEQCSFGCIDGSCVSRDEQIFEPLILFSDWLVEFVPVIGKWVFLMGMVSLVIYILFQIGGWI